MIINPLAGKPAPLSLLIDIPKLVAAYYTEKPDPKIPSQMVSFGTSGHRGSSFDKSFNEDHILAITQAICLYRIEQNITGPLFLGIDTHALSYPAMITALEVLAANNATVMLAENDEYTPTPVISHAILCHNKNNKKNLSDGIVITPSHNPPKEGGFKYNPPNGGPADTSVTDWIQNKANNILLNGMKEVKRTPYEIAKKASTTKYHNYMENYVKDLCNVIDMDVIKNAGISIGVDPLGGAGVHYWKMIADHYKLNMTVVDDVVDPTFRFMSVDWDGQIRMDPSSPYAMQRLIKLKDRFDIACGCDTDHDRHGIITKSIGLLPPNHFMSSAIWYLFNNRKQWSNKCAVGKTIVSSLMIDKVTKKLGRELFEVPVGFKWFAEGLFTGKLSFVGEESAGSAFARRDGTVWTTDKDGITPSLLAAEITAKLGKDPAELYKDLTQEFGISYYDRVEASATTEQKKRLKSINVDQITSKLLGGEKITSILTKAPGDNAPIGGIKVIAENGWFAARPSGTENIYKIYVESFLGKQHLAKITEEAQAIVDKAISS